MNLSESAGHRTESILEPELPIVDAHHHLWFLTQQALNSVAESHTIAAQAYPSPALGPSRYLFDELMADLTTGHNVRATVFVDAHAMYRADGPAAMRSVGEVEFVNGVAAMGASGVFGNIKVCAGIVGNVDLRLGDAAREVLQAHVQAGGGRYRGVRFTGGMAYDEDESILGPGGVPRMLFDSNFRQGFKWLERLGLGERQPGGGDRDLERGATSDRPDPEASGHPGAPPPTSSPGSGKLPE